MRTVQESVDVAAPPERVWAVITDLAGSAEVIAAIDRIEVLTGGEFGVGTTWRETRTMFGKQATEEMRVSAVEPGRAYTVVADSNGAHYESTFRIEPTAGGCRLTADFGAEPTSTFARVAGAAMWPLMKGSMVKALRQDLQDIAAAAEGPRGS